VRRILYDKAGLPQHYLTGAGVLYSLENRFVGALQGEPGLLLNLEGYPVAWFAEGFVWDASGVLAFVKGAVPQGDLALPRTVPLRAKLAPTPAPLRPLLVQMEPPPLLWVWAERTLADVLTSKPVV
jgi:hypothetical protein